MAEDTIGLLRELELEPAHVIGASMGGMIAQTLAARHPQQVRSLVSIMSNTGRLRTGQPSLRIYPQFIKRLSLGRRDGHPDREAYVAAAEGLFATIGSLGLPRDPQDIRELAEVSYDRDHDPDGTSRQLAAIIASGDRTAELGRITAPTLVIHGTADPLVAYSGGRATARAIPGARLMSIEGMGHDLPRAIWPRLTDAIARHAKRADEQSERQPRSATTRSATSATYPSRPRRRRSRASWDRPSSPSGSLSRCGGADCRPAGLPSSVNVRSSTSAGRAAPAPASAGHRGSASACRASARGVRGASVSPGK